MAKQAFQLLDLPKAHMSLPDLCACVVENRGRIQIDCGERHCVLISKEELDALERALEILSDTDGVRSLCGAIEHVAVIARPGSAF